MIIKQAIKLFVDKLISDCRSVAPRVDPDPKNIRIVDNLVIINGFPPSSTSDNLTIPELIAVLTNYRAAGRVTHRDELVDHRRRNTVFKSDRSKRLSAGRKIIILLQYVCLKIMVCKMLLLLSFQSL